MSNQILTVDIECTTSNKGNPFDRTNKLVLVGHKWLGESAHCHHPDEPGYQRFLQSEINRASLVVGFNIKFDLHWLRNMGIDISNISVWDCQLAEFMLECQTNPYNSLNQACIKYDLPTKLDVVKSEYWDKGIDTDQIPVDILREYLEMDLTCTENVFKMQYKQMTGKDI